MWKYENVMNVEMKNTIYEPGFELIIKHLLRRTLVRFYLYSAG